MAAGHQHRHARRREEHVLSGGVLADGEGAALAPRRRALQVAPDEIGDHLEDAVAAHAGGDAIRGLLERGDGIRHRY